MGEFYGVVAQRLREARALIDAPDKWAQGHSAYLPGAYNIGLVPCSPLCEYATGYCVTGALQRAFGDVLDDRRDYAGSYFDEAARLLAMKTYEYDEAEEFLMTIGHIASWNDDDEREHSEVMGLFDSAIETAERLAG